MNFRRRIASFMLLGALTLTLTSSLCFAEDAAAVKSERAKVAPDPTIEDYFYFEGATGFDLPALRSEKVFRPPDGRANFTSFSGVKDVRVEDGKLTFITTTGNRAVIGWGNYRGKQALEDIQSLLPSQLDTIIRVRQSSEKSTWAPKYWCDGKVMPKQTRDDPKAVELKGTQWKNIRITHGYGFAPCPTPDGLELGISAPKGTRFEIEWVKFTQPRAREGYFRKEFDLPAGKIWKAVANVGGANERVWFYSHKLIGMFYLNGKVVERPIPAAKVCAYPIDITKYVHAGANCAAFHGRTLSQQTPDIFLQAKIIMASGQVISVNTDETWKSSSVEEAGWKAVGFDDSGWKPPSPLRISFSQQSRAPGYLGFLDIRNPNRRDLFYPDTNDVVVNVLTPRGFAVRSPSLEWVIGKGNQDGTSTQMDRGEVSFFEEIGTSLVYRINLGRREHGVYTIALKLIGEDGAVIEERSREPFVVLRKIPFKEITGTDYREGLDLELEDTINFTDPNDKHPWVEGVYTHSSKVTAPEKPKIVKQGNLTYREVTGSRRGSYFSYRFEFRHPGDFYLIEVDYPDDSDRCIEVVICSKKEKSFADSEAGLGAETGGKFYKTGTMKTLRWIHVADSGPHSVDIINVQTGWRAAAKSLRVYHIKGDLPSVGSGDLRDYGIHTERCFPSSGIGRNFGIGSPLTLTREEKRELPLVQRAVRNLVWMKETSERYLQYLKFSGQNLHLLGCIQYDEINTPFIPAPPTDSSSAIPCMRTMLANVLDMNELSFLCGIEYGCTWHARTYSNNAQVARGEPTMWMVDANGKQYDQTVFGAACPNFLSPEYREAYYRILDDIVRTFGGLKHFRGVSNFFGPSQRVNYYMPAFGIGHDWDNPLALSFDDLTFDLFEQDTGTKLLVDRNDLLRFQKRAELVKNAPALRRKFLDWRCQRVAALYEELVKRMNRKRADAKFYNLLAVEVESCFRELIESKKTFAELMKEFGIDLDLLGRITNMNIMRWTVSWRELRREKLALVSQQPYTWVPKEDDIVISAFDKVPHRGVMCRTSWDENLKITPGHKFTSNYGNFVEDSDWLFDATRTRALPQPGGYNAREAIIQAIITSDPEIVLAGFTDLNINVGHEQVLRETMRTFTYLPPDNFTNVLKTDLRTNLAIRKLVKGNESYFYIANPGYWRIMGTVKLKAGGAITMVPDGKKISDGGNIALPVKLAPFGLIAYRVASKDLDILAYETGAITQHELSHMTRIMTRVRELASHKLGSQLFSADDLKLIDQVLSEADRAIQAKKYALAWSVLKNPRFWTLAYERGAITGGDQAEISEIMSMGKRILSDEQACRFLSRDDLKLFRGILSEAEKAVREKKTVLAWSLLKDPRFYEQYRALHEKVVSLDTETAVGPFLIQGWQVSKRMEKTGDACHAACVRLDDDLGWQPLASDKPDSGRIYVYSLFGNQDGIVYLGNRIKVFKTGRFEARLGHDGGARMFVDGKPVLCNSGSRPPITPDRSRVPVDLTEGEHEIMVALDLANGIGQGIRFRFGTTDGKQMRVRDFPLAVSQ